MLFNSPLARHRPMSTIEFEQQLDYLCQWLDAWTDVEVNYNFHVIAVKQNYNNRAQYLTDSFSINNVLTAVLCL